MLTPGDEGICANAFERERLAWIKPILIEDNILSAPMGDYITTPSAYKYNLNNDILGEAYYFENHQQISIYDNSISNPDDRGIFILHFKHGYYMYDCPRLLTSDGFWNWESPKTVSCWGNEIPALKKAKVNRGGRGNRDRIFIDSTLSTFLYAYIDDDDRVECNDWLHGYGFNNAFNTNFNNVFSNWSNPPAKTWDGKQTDFYMEIKSQCGSIVTACFVIKNSIYGKPSKPLLSWDPNKLESDNNEGGINLVWGADYWDGDPIEPDVNWSELQQKVGSGSWRTIYSGPNRYWSDGNVDYGLNESEISCFRVRVRDTQNKWSIWSELLDIKNVISNLVGNNTNDIPSDFILNQNYPNPFNPLTTIRYSVPQTATVTIKVFDILGNEIETLVNEEKPVGNYEVEFNAISLPSGVYFNRLQAGSFVEIRKMVLMK
ncbi:MAG: T9SS type A sorting domain-containing protein [Ignavibacteriaceae bacterium]